jgi:hypothetical protein
VTINIGSAAALYKELIAATGGYAGDAPTIHQAVAVKAAIGAAEHATHTNQTSMSMTALAKADGVSVEARGPTGNGGYRNK